MLRLILGAILGVVVWFAVAIGVSIAIREAAPPVAAALNAHVVFAALCARLGISFLASILAGLAAALISRESARAPLAAGVLLLIWFVPYHLSIWPQFPIWYHLTFFVSLLLLSLIGGRLAGPRRP
ncbi:MAG TPA: hypothetical protein VGB91_01785 [Rhizomicrobium sp.]